MPRAVLFAAVALLAQAGCRPLTPGAEVLPTRPARPAAVAAVAARSDVAAATPVADADPAVVPASASSPAPGSPPQVPSTPPPPKPTEPDPPGMAAKTLPERGQVVGMAVARVGEEEITYAELLSAVEAETRERVKPGEQLTRREMAELTNLLAEGLLNHMIERLLIVQHVKQVIHDPKKWNQFQGAIDKQFDEEKLPGMLKRADAANEDELRAKLLEKGESLDQIRKNFRMDTTTSQYLYGKIRPKVKPELPAMEAYYAAHLKDYDSPATITFREIVVPLDGPGGRAEAVRKAGALRVRLRREDFGKVARAESTGATASKGGLWEKVRPGGFAEPINRALETLPLRTVSAPIETPNGLSILLVEGRRKAGPLSFPEVQSRVADDLTKVNYEREVTAFIAKLRSRTVVTTEIALPAREKPADPAVRRASTP